MLSLAFNAALPLRRLSSQRGGYRQRCVTPPSAVLGLFRRSKKSKVSVENDTVTSTSAAEAAVAAAAAASAEVASEARTSISYAPSPNLATISMTQPYLIPVKRRTEGPRRDLVFVVGGAGRLGQELLRRLLERNVRRIYAQIPETKEGKEGLIADKRIVYIPGDAGSTTSVKKLAEEIRICGAGSVVFAASGGPSACRDVDNKGVEALAEEIESILGESIWGSRRDIFNFSAKNATELRSAFVSIDDVVMGGMSSSRMVEANENDGSGALFKGTVTTARNGGFALMRARVADVGKDALDLSDYDGIAMKCMGDGRRYKINLKDDAQPEIVFQASFESVKGEWQTVRIPFDEFVPVRRGKLVYREGPATVYPNIGTYALNLNTSNILTIGVVVSKIEPGGLPSPDFYPGEFQLQIDSIWAYTQQPPRFTLVSSAAVERPYWSEQRRAMDGALAKIPIVQLNPGNILGHKLAGENALRRTDLAWTVVRPLGLSENVQSGKKLRVAQGDMISGVLSREDAARGIVAAMFSPSAAFRTFELGAFKENAPQNENDLLEDALGALEAMKVDALYADATDKL